MLKEQKFILYSLKIIGLLIIFGLALTIIAIYSLNNQINSEETINLLYYLLIDISSLIIAMILIVFNINKKFNEEKNQLKDLRSSLINIRYESSYKLIKELGSEEDKKELLNNFKLCKFKEPFFINPILINKIIAIVRKFNINPVNQSCYADTFGVLIKSENYEDLQGLDNLILETYKLLKNYGVRRDYINLKKGIGSFNDNILMEIEELLEKKDYDYLRKLFFMDLDWALIYNYHDKKPHPLALYRKEY